jgi:hypothetical protein
MLGVQDDVSHRAQFDYEDVQQRVLGAARLGVQAAKVDQYRELRIIQLPGSVLMDKLRKTELSSFASEGPL